MYVIKCDLKSNLYNSCSSRHDKLVILKVGKDRSLEDINLMLIIVTFQYCRAEFPQVTDIRNP